MVGEWSDKAVGRLGGAWGALIRRCWKTSVNVRSQVCIASPWSERLLCKKEALAPDMLKHD